MSCRALIAMACVLGAQISGVSADAPVTFERTVATPDGSTSSTVRTSVTGKGAKVSGRATTAAVDGDGNARRTNVTFSADAVSSGIDTPASPGDENSPNDAIEEPTGSTVLKRNDLKPISKLTRACGCKSESGVVTSDIREISDTWMAKGDAMNTHKLSNMIWAWGQFVDHDIVATIDDLDGPTFTVKLEHGDKSADMTLHRLVAPVEDGCPVPPQIHTAAIDASQVYGTDEAYLKGTLREPNSCKLRTSEDNMLPITTKADSKGRFFFIAGDARVDEHAMLTSMHTLWMREHNRLCDELGNSLRSEFMSTDEQFELIRKVVGAKVQEITMREFLPALGLTHMDVRQTPKKRFGSEITVEFATAAYRMGHDFVPDKIGTFSTKNIFNGQDFFLEQKDGGWAMRSDANKRLDRLLSQGCKNLAAERDGKLSDTLRNTLFGDFGEDLASRNIFRARDMGIVDYKDLASCYGAKPEQELASQMDDSFVALLKESSDEVLPATLRTILRTQFHEIFFGNEDGWWMTSGGGYAGFVHEIATTTLSKVIKDNTGASVGSDCFHVSD
eukprot:jgi/Ulvmu1/10345/UM061_0028.1